MIKTYGTATDDLDMTFSKSVLCGECKANVMCLCAQMRGNASNLKYSFNTHSTMDGWRHTLSPSPLLVRT